MSTMRRFPDFMRRASDAVKSDGRSGGTSGHVFDGASGTQIVIWECEHGGKSEMHTHDFDEYAIVVQGTFEGTVGGVPVSLGPGDECFIPAGVPHDGVYSPNYRAIDAFGGQRIGSGQRASTRQDS